MGCLRVRKGHCGRLWGWVDLCPYAIFMDNKGELRLRLSNHFRSFKIALLIPDDYMSQYLSTTSKIPHPKQRISPIMAFTMSFPTPNAMKVGPWYNDLHDSPQSCCALHDVATEFSCQGLELDFPIVCWGSDLRWEEGDDENDEQSQWKSPMPADAQRPVPLIVSG